MHQSFNIDRKETQSIISLLIFASLSRNLYKNSPGRAPITTTTTSMTLPVPF